MKIEEALKYYRKGSSIRRRIWQQDKKAFELYGVPYLTRIDVEAQDWEVVRKQVGWNEAWEALQQGKKILVGDKEWKMVAHRDRLIEWTNCDGVMSSVEAYIPLSWLDRTDFEIVEDE